MKLYHWESNALRDYSAGNIIVMAENVQEARRIVMAQAKAQFAWLAKQSYAEHIADIAADISTRPLRSEPAIFIYGGG